MTASARTTTPACDRSWTVSASSTSLPPSTDYYAAGRFDAALIRILQRFDKVMEVILPTLGPDRRATYSPILPLHPRTGIVMQVPMQARNPAAGTVVWRDPETNETFETSVKGGACKLQWKADWAMRWYALDVDYEMSGKDLIDSVRLSSRICRILGAPPPETLTYELFLDENGQRISKSKGNGLPVEEWLRYAPQESLGQFMYNAPQRAKRLYFDVIPRAVDEYLGNAARLPTQPEAERPTNPAWHIHAGRLPNHAGSPVSFGMLLNLASVVNAETPAMLWGFIRRYSPGASPETMPFLDKLVDHAIAYYRDFVRPEKRYRHPTDTERTALTDLAETLRGVDAADHRCRNHPEHRLRGRQAPPVPRTACLVRLPVPGAARPAGGTALRRVHRPVWRRRNSRADPGRARPPRRCRLTHNDAARPTARLLQTCAACPPRARRAVAGRRHLRGAEGVPTPQAGGHRHALDAIPRRSLVISFRCTVVSYSC